MIVDAILGAFRAVVQGMIDLLPSWAPPDVSGELAGLSALWGYMGWANKYVPLVEIAALMTVLLAVHVGMYLVKFGLWVLTKAHVLGGS